MLIKGEIKTHKRLMKITWPLFFFLGSSGYVYCQSWTIDARFTPNLISKPKVVNPSLSKIYGERRIGFDSGISISRYLNNRIGLSAGWDWGIVDWNFYIEGPRNAFGDARGEGLLNENLNIENFSYKALSIRILLYNVPVRKKVLKISAGPAFRYYRMEEDAIIFGYALNRTIPYDENDPSHGPLDVLVHIEPLGKKLYLNIPVSLNYQLFATKGSNFNLGVLYNIAPKPIADSELTVVMNQNTYKGKFSPRTSFWGVNMQYEFSLEKQPPKNTRSLRKQPLKDSQSPIIDNSYRKSLFAELAGNAIGISTNFDMRFRPGRNDGLGFRAGIGTGLLYYSDNNRYYETQYVSMPLNLNYIVGNRRSGFETGIGGTSQFALGSVNDHSQAQFEGFLTAGYRFQPLTKGLMLRANWIPTVNKSGIDPATFGVSAGYSFK